MTRPAAVTVPGSRAKRWTCADGLARALVPKSESIKGQAHPTIVRRVTVRRGSSYSGPFIQKISFARAFKPGDGLG